jgi:SAM-dependent methyltransferase
MRQLWPLYFLISTLYVTSLQIEFPAYFYEPGNVQNFSFDEDGDVYDLLSPRCSDFKTEYHCFEAMDLVSFYMYGFSTYTPRLPHRTIEDSGTSRGNVLGYLIGQYGYTRYLEIGCDLNYLFDVIRPVVSVAVGVDPNRGGTHRMTSDEFFAQNSDTYDIVFVDGDHTAVQTLKDVDNALKVLSPNGTIVLHDCNPRFEHRQYKSSEIYNGDVWKVMGPLRARPDLEAITIDVDHGVGVVRRRPNLHPLPSGLLQKVTSAANPLDAFTYADLEQSREELLRLMTVAGFREWLQDENTASSAVDP